MRAIALIASCGGVLISLYVSLDAYRNSAATSYPFQWAFLATSLVFAAVGVAGALLTWRSNRLGPWLLIGGAFGGFAVWPWLSAGLAYLVAAALSFIALAASPDSSHQRTPN